MTWLDNGQRKWTEIFPKRMCRWLIGTWKIEISYKDKTKKFTNIWWLNSMILDHEWIKKKSKGKSKTIDKWKWKYNILKSMGCNKPSLRQNFIAKQFYLKKARKISNQQSKLTLKETKMNLVMTNWWSEYKNLVWIGYWWLYTTKKLFFKNPKPWSG